MIYRPLTKQLNIIPTRELKLELPFTLSHPIPEHYEEDMEPPPQPTDANADNINLELDETGTCLIELG